jgi:hypothetical protein
MSGWQRLVSKRRQRWVAIAGLCLLLAAAAMTIGLFRSRHSPSAARARSSEQPGVHLAMPPGFLWRIQNGASRGDLEGMRQAVIRELQRHPRLDVNTHEQVSFESLQVSGDWAFAEEMERSRQTGAAIKGEGAVILLKRVDGQWQAALGGTPIFERWLPQVPSALMPSEAKLLLR